MSFTHCDVRFVTLCVSMFTIGIADVSLVAAPNTVLQTFLNPTPEVNDWFGQSVAVVGAPNDDTGANDAGAAYVFDALSTELVQTLFIRAPGAFFGASVAFLGDDALVGARRWNFTYLFDVATGNTIQGFLDPGFGTFGMSVARAGNNVVIGGGKVRGTDFNYGAAHLFDLSTGRLLQTFVKPVPELGDQFGHRVAAVGDNVLIGAPRSDSGAPDAGAAYLFEAATGNLLQTFLNPTPSQDDHFGASVASVGDKVLIGAPLADAVGVDAGEVYLFDATTAELLTTFHGQTCFDGIGCFSGLLSEQFGTSIASSGNTIVVGARHNNLGAGAAGAAYLFEYEREHDK